MNITCKNCGQTFKGNYCNHCGQSSKTHRLNYASIWVDIRLGLFHFNDKLAFTTRQLFERPGHAIREYIEGKRLKYFQPVSYVIVVGSVYVLLSLYFPIHIIVDSDGSRSVFAGMGYNEANQWLIRHYSQLMLATVPLLAISTFVIFRKQGYNFVEHLVISCYATGQRLLLLIVTFPLQYLVDHTAYNQSYKWVIVVVEFLLAYWIYSQFFKDLSKAKTLWLLLLSYSMFFALLMGVSYLSLVIIEYFI
jgi:hypothetical protein